jgi:hypothetical protein
MATEAHGRTLPPPTKPKRQGHQPPPEPAPEPAVAVPERPRSRTAPPAPPTPVAPTEAPAIRTTVYSDPHIKAFMQNVRRNAIGRLDLTESAVWRWAVEELMERYSPEAVVERFEKAQTEQGRVGRPRR